MLEVSQITQGLKALAKELAIPVLALSQFSHARWKIATTSGRSSSDLRESGSIEQDADAVMFIYRDEYYLKQKMPKEIAFGGSGDKFHAAMDGVAATHGEGTQSCGSDYCQAAPWPSGHNSVAVRE